MPPYMWCKDALNFDIEEWHNSDLMKLGNAKEIFDAKQDVQVIGPGQSIDISDFITSTEP